MNLPKFVMGLAAGIGLAVIVGAGIVLWQQRAGQVDPPDESAIHSPYAGQEVRGIKALSQEDIEGLLAGSGTPFGGMAKPAELNGYPGPRHVLDAVEAGEFELAGEQQAQIETLYEEVRSEAVVLGEAIIAVEEEVDDAYAEGTITLEFLQEKLEESASLYGQLRLVHLQAHLVMVEILTPEQVAEYNDLRGYSSAGPCASVPEGHDPEQWRMHNNCD